MITHVSRMSDRACSFAIVTALILGQVVNVLAQDGTSRRSVPQNRSPSRIDSGVRPQTSGSEDLVKSTRSVQARAPSANPERSATRQVAPQFVQASQQFMQASQQPPENDWSAGPDREPVRAESKAANAVQSIQPWWHNKVQEQTRDVPRTVPITLESLLLSALSYSSQVRVYSELPLIREMAIYEADAAFDPAAFVESRWDDTNDPVGNKLTTGGATRYKNDQWSGAGGLRKRTRVGGTLEVSERFGWQRTNSIYFQPPVQGTSKLAISYAQPLLRGRGQVYNESLIVLAEMDRSVSEFEFSRQLQSHLMEVARAYWSLYFERANLVQKRRSVTRASMIKDELVARVNLDAVESQIQRAEAEVATRQSELVRAEMAVENAEANIRTLVNDPALGEDESEIELIPMELPIEDKFKFDMQTALTVALLMRPEIEQAFRQIKAGGVRADMSKNELLPVLTLVTEAYVAGLQGGGSVGDAFTDQFRVGAPGYSVGLQFEVPIGNRAAQSRNDRRLFELRQLRNQYETTIKTVSLEVEVAVREVETSYNEMLAQRRAMTASRAQYITLQKRWKVLPGEGGTASLMLENLLTAQERLTRAETAYTQAWISYNLALIGQRKATGELLQYHGVSWSDFLKEHQTLRIQTQPSPTVPRAAPEVKDNSANGPVFQQPPAPVRGVFDNEAEASLENRFKSSGRSNRRGTAAEVEAAEMPPIEISSYKSDRSDPKTQPGKRSYFGFGPKQKSQ